jgi:flotillin
LHAAAPQGFLRLSHEANSLDEWKREVSMFGLPFIPVVAGLAVLAVLLGMALLARMFRKAGPHEALIIYGLRGTRIVKGGGTIIFPMIEQCRELSLELMSFDVAPQQSLYTKQGVAVTIEAVAQIKVKSDPESIRTAAEQFLTKRPEQREGLIRLVMEGHLRGIIGQLTVEQIVKEPEMVADRMRSTCADDMNKMGLEVVSFTLKEVRDKNEYITNMGRPDIARIKRDAEVAAAEADRDIAIKRAEATRASAVAKAQADQERVAAETASLAKQAEAERDLDIKKASYLEMTKKAQATADKAYEIETNVMQQRVVEESVRVQQVEREAQVKVQEAEIARRERELIATVLKQAEIERQRIETLANAERQRLMSEAEGRASAIRAQGEAEAEIIFKKGEAEAKAMNIKAEAFQEYNQAAVVDKLISGLPEVVRALAEPLSKVDKVTIVSTGNGDAAGAYKLTGDITKIAAQVPALFEALSGMQVSDLLSKVRLIGDKAPKSEKPEKTAAPKA